MLEGDDLEDEDVDNKDMIEKIDDIDIIVKKHDLAGFLRDYYNIFEVMADLSSIERPSFTDNKISCNYFIYMTGSRNPFAYIKAGPEIVIHKQFKDTNLADTLLEALRRFNVSEDKDYYIGTVFYL